MGMQPRENGNSVERAAAEILQQVGGVENEGHETGGNAPQGIDLPDMFYPVWIHHAQVNDQG